MGKRAVDNLAANPPLTSLSRHRLIYSFTAQEARKSHLPPVSRFPDSVTVPPALRMSSPYSRFYYARITPRHLPGTVFELALQD